MSPHGLYHGNRDLCARRPHDTLSLITATHWLASLKHGQKFYCFCKLCYIFNLERRMQYYNILYIKIKFSALISPFSSYILCSFIY